MYFTIPSLYNVDILQRSLESLGFTVRRNSKAYDYFKRDIGCYPLVASMQELHADIYLKGETLYADLMDEMYLKSLRIHQRYSELVVQDIIKNVKGLLVVDNILPDREDVVYQLTWQMPINVTIKKDGKAHLTIFDAEGSPLVTIPASI